MKFNFGCNIIWEHYFFVLFPFFLSFYRLLSAKHHRDYKGQQPMNQKTVDGKLQFSLLSNQNSMRKGDYSLYRFLQGLLNANLQSYIFFLFNFNSHKIYIFAVNRFFSFQGFVAKCEKQEEPRGNSETCSNFKDKEASILHYDKKDMLSKLFTQIENVQLF